MVASSTKISRTLFGVLIAVCIGCGPSGPEKIVVTGTVRFNGNPIGAGNIHFVPIEGTQGPVSNGDIKDGQYRVENKGGVPVGKHRVEIEGYRPAKVAAPGISLEETFADQYVPAKYNTSSELTTEFKSGEGAVIRDYDLQP